VFRFFCKLLHRYPRAATKGFQVAARRKPSGSAIEEAIEVAIEEAIDSTPEGSRPAAKICRDVAERRKPSGTFSSIRRCYAT